MSRVPLLISAFLVFLIAPDLGAAGRQRPARLLLTDGESSEWLRRNAHVLETVEYPSASADLEPLRVLAGNADVVALADATHGTREFYTLKVRIIDFLVREMDFDAVAIEAPFAVGNRLNDYVLGRGGDPRETLADLNERLYYRFWDVEEVLEVLEWIRSWNSNRGERPPVVLAGFDTLDPEGAAEGVLRYLEELDPAAAVAEGLEYACIGDPRALDCAMRATDVRDRLAARRDELTSVGSPEAFENALQNAVVVVQSFAYPERDEGMARNVEWIRTNRSETGRIILWSHQEHAGRTESPWVAGRRSMGWHLSRVPGLDYFVIGTLTGGGAVRLWQQRTGSLEFTSIVRSIPEPEQGAYEAWLSKGPAAAFFISIRGAVPSWLRRAAPYFTMGQTPGHDRMFDSLAEKLDAVIYIENTTPTRPNRRYPQ